MRLPVHLREVLPDDGGLGIEHVSLFVEVDGQRGVFRFAGVLVLLLVDVAHRVIEIGVGTGRWCHVAARIRLCLRWDGLREASGGVDG